MLRLALFMAWVSKSLRANTFPYTYDNTRKHKIVILLLFPFKQGEIVPWSLVELGCLLDL